MPFYLLLDIGSDGSLLHKKSFDFLNFGHFITDPTHIHVKIADKVDEVIHFKVDENFSILGNYFLNPIPIGHLGNLFFKNRTLYIDLKNEKIGIDEKIDIQTFIELNASFSDDTYAIIHIQIEGINYKMLYDTGASTNLIFFKKEYLDRYQHTIGKSEEAIMVFGNNKNIHESNEMFCVDLEKIKVESKISYVENFESDHIPFDGVLGVSFFKGYEIFIDYVHQKFYVKPQNE